MKKLAAALMIALPFCFGSAIAEDKAHSQQNKMAMCNKEAGDKKGDERKAFMSDCLKKKETQQSKMTSCNKEAGDKKGDERKKFMSECLKK
jgi:hypothetical protein